ncbi:hypothetical protein CYMTET_52714 [Cymbomonas tetramitiformis]|uniref:Methyltransferase FkbM domain-containing protein n=1 Tax=Cymbomonas tetramitiformis TaxID=36881 RepID=A0AAE0BJU3_9CHLO|nr:hypothetical protein CYMTET_52714 [Cymbomonas tetramitiformis]|eukprot:gene27606-34064_t
MSKLPQDRVFVDVGADVGFMSLAIADLGYRVFAFEPIPYSQGKLCEGITWNNFSNLVTVFPFAAGSEALDNVPFYTREDGHLGSSSLHRNAIVKDRKLVRDIHDPTIDSHNASHWKKINVIPIRTAVRRLDAVIPRHEKLGILKVDAQGADFNVLKGATGLLNRTVAEGAPYQIVFEFDLRFLVKRISDHNWREYEPFMASMKYKCNFPSYEKLEAQEADVATLRRSDDVSCTKV